MTMTGFMQLLGPTLIPISLQKHMPWGMFANKYVSESQARQDAGESCCISCRFSWVHSCCSGPKSNLGVVLEERGLTLSLISFSWSKLLCPGGYLSCKYNCNFFLHNSNFAGQCRVEEETHHLLVALPNLLSPHLYMCFEWRRRKKPKKMFWTESQTMWEIWSRILQCYV